MYIPPIFRQSDLEVMHHFMERHAFALLCSTDDSGVPCANHLPLILQRPNLILGHMARANSQWRDADGKKVLVVYSGPHHYISPAWYQSENVVPTWNFLAVHVTGTFRALPEPEAIWPIMKQMVGVFERGKDEPWPLEVNDFTRGRLADVVGFSVQIETIEGKWKLGQNHPRERRLRGIEALRQLGGEDALAIAELMARLDG